MHAGGFNAGLPETLQNRGHAWTRPGKLGRMATLSLISFGLAILVGAGGVLAFIALRGRLVSSKDAADHPGDMSDAAIMLEIAQNANDCLLYSDM